MKDQVNLQTVEDLIRQLSSFPKHYEVDFSGLDFYRFKKRGEALIQVEFNQQVYRTDSGDVVVENLE